MTPRVSVVIPHYFAVRARHLLRIAADLKRSTVKPHEVLVWNNDTPESLPPLAATGLAVIQGEGNLGCQARIKAAKRATGDYVLFMDNDTTLEPRAIVGLLRWSAAIPGAIVTLEGRRCLGPDVPYRHWPKTYGSRITEPRRMTMSLGRGELVPAEALRRMLPRFPFGPTETMDDLWWSACAAWAGVPIYAVPCKPGAGLLNLPRYGTGASATTGYYEARDLAVEAIRAHGPTRIWTDVEATN